MSERKLNNSRNGDCRRDQRNSDGDANAKLGESPPAADNLRTFPERSAKFSN
jgi:hypothetical protein